MTQIGFLHLVWLLWNISCWRIPEIKSREEEKVKMMINQPCFSSKNTPFPKCAVDEKVQRTHSVTSSMKPDWHRGQVYSCEEEREHTSLIIDMRDSCRQHKHPQDKMQSIQSSRTGCQQDTVDWLSLSLSEGKLQPLKKKIHHKIATKS